MSHNLSIVDGKAEAAFSKVGAWHGLGEVSYDVMTSAEAIKLAHLDWTIDVHQLIHQGKETGHYYTARNDNNVVLGSGMSDGYEPLQNIEAFNFMDSLNDMGMLYESAFALGKGEKVVVLARMPEIDEIAEGDTTQRYLLLSTSHDGSGSVIVMPTSVRVVCANTLAIALSEKTGKIKVKHTSKMQERLAIAKLAIKACNHEFGDLLEKSRALAQKKITSDSFKAYLDIVYPLASDAKQNANTRNVNIKADVTKIFNEEATCNLDSIKGTWWAAFNAVTFKEDHDGITRVTEGTNEAQSRFESITTGTIAKRKTLALNAAVTMAA